MNQKPRKAPPKEPEFIIALAKQVDVLTQTVASLVEAQKPSIKAEPKKQNSFTFHVETMPAILQAPEVMTELSHIVDCFCKEKGILKMHLTYSAFTSNA